MPTELTGTSGYVHSGDVKLHYLEYAGEGRPLVAVPGITSPAPTFEFAAVELAQRHRVITLDVRGRGLSDTPADGYTLDVYAADVAALIEQLELDRPIILGHSMGARIAAAFGAIYPDRRGPLVLVDPPLTGPGRGEYPIALQTFKDQLVKAKAGATADDMRPYFPAWTDAQLELRAEWLPTCDETAVVETWENFHRENVHELFLKLKPPVLFMYGLESPMVTAEGAAEVVQANPLFTPVGIRGAGHMIMFDNLPDFIIETEAFLDQVS